MEQKIVTLNMVEIAQKYVQHWEERVRQNGSKLQYPFWNEQEMLALLADLSPQLSPDTELHIMGVTPAWVMGSLVRLVHPAQVSFYRDAEHFSATLPLRMAAPGEAPDPAGGIDFTVEQDGDKTFLTFLADDVRKGSLRGNHNYDMALLPHVTTPWVNPDCHLYIRGAGAYPVSMSILKTYFGHCRSISLLDHDRPLYTCIVTDSDARRLGETFPGQDVPRD